MPCERCESAEALARERAERIERLKKALQNMLHGEWMVTHDWGGDRNSILAEAEAALAPAQEAPTE